jgi:tetratricopeptide (TPR) repeat protein
LGRLSWEHPYSAHLQDSTIWLTVPFVLMKYLAHLIAPFYLSLLYGTPFAVSFSDLHFLLPFVAFLGFAALLLIYRKRIGEDVWAGLGLLFIPLLPVLNLKVFHYEYIVQDRYLYLPSIGFCFLTAFLISGLMRRSPPLAAVLALVILASFAVGTLLQNRVWRDSVSLWSRSVSTAPGSWSAHYNLGLAYLNAKRNDEAREQFLVAKAAKPDEPSIYNNLAIAQSGLGDPDNAILTLQQSLALDPASLEAHNNLGSLFYEKGRYEDARQEFLKTLARDPASLSARFNLARTLQASGDKNGAVREYEALLSRDPDDAAARYQLALSYAAVGRRADAVSGLQRALSTERDPSQAEEMRKALETLQSSPQ